MLVEIRYSIGYGGHKDEIEVEDDATEEDIEKQVQDAVVERLDWSWKKVS